MAQDLQAHAVRYAREPNEANREAVVLAAIPLVRSVVGRLSIPDHPLATREDLENVGILGLLQALEGYDPERGTPFVSYAYGRIRGALVDYLRSIDALPRERRRKLAEAHQALDTLRQVLGAEPSDQDVADYLGISLVEYHTLLRDAQCRFSLSLHSPVDVDGEQIVLETIPNEDTFQAFEQIDRASLREYIQTLIKELPEREQTILALYYFENLTLREIAGLMNRTEARISQILGKILMTLRTQLTRAQSRAA
ncbi:FliA/WhiG family RNA polymerase sigma factor [Rhodocaloribacter litoris]|uniref:sigma-70 family RNA polymerase sigma factor n=1 Tax=Rhodocaloribacter litoris TaxID=2558931 RepID=UPI0014235623|nr:FliA/WhiG family RNA polymerase sigma factor [Rhodocaloribacter litoris]QXD16071.1 FliA/WhiG family RNA polymerase sigma factor [Rhodocaloribacter litoris]GIV59804.1 MAG: DNA-directed RNA polymerase sigma-70 factor [Rhodothermaceae bacterium]